ncbi:hypothetical protein GWI33_016962 [Rhynchophorus ferrugineus]|uniref:Integrase catalytic domain-containing protein n=1 Tax=Rhynchophorus ferrugineus TaxID=354439 RepID=A0A834IA60_RHYFE|nr:hypothetical protein GWI33_016962 [Rhynchophorus ferrugineus]
MPVARVCQQATLAGKLECKQTLKIRHKQQAKIKHFQNKCPNKERNDDKARDTCNAFNEVFLNGSFSKLDWYIDSGARVHLIANREWLNDVQSQMEVKNITVANKTKVPVICSGKTNLRIIVGPEFQKHGRYSTVTVKSDNGGAFCSKEFEKILASNGIIHQKTNLYNPQQNDMPERMNRTPVENAWWIGESPPFGGGQLLGYLRQN